MVGLRPFTVRGLGDLVINLPTLQSQWALLWNSLGRRQSCATWRFQKGNDGSRCCGVNSQVREGDNPVFFLPSTNCAKLAFLEGNLGTPCMVTLAYITSSNSNHSWQPIVMLRLFTTEHLILQRKVKTEDSLYPYLDSNTLGIGNLNKYKPARLPLGKDQ